MGTVKRVESAQGWDRFPALHFSEINGKIAKLPNVITECHHRAKEALFGKMLSGRERERERKPPENVVLDLIPE